MKILKKLIIFLVVIISIPLIAQLITHGDNLFPLATIAGYGLAFVLWFIWNFEGGESSRDYSEDEEDDGSTCSRCGGKKDCSMICGCRDHYHCDCGIVRGNLRKSNKQRYEEKQIKKVLKKRGY